MPGELLLQALDKAWNVLKPLDVPMAVLGGLAVSIFDHARSTRDVDILLQVESKDADRIIDTLLQSGIKPRRVPALMHLEQQWILFLYYQPPGAFYEVKIDLLFADNEYQRAALTRRIPAQLPGSETEIFILGCEDLILHKLRAGRVIDRADCSYLVRANRAILDLPYLNHWLETLGLKANWLEIWDEAFPGEPSPI